MFYYQFHHGGRIVELGPTASEYEAKMMFQQRYGYWPDDAVSYDMYAKSPISERQW